MIDVTIINSEHERAEEHLIGAVNEEKDRLSSDGYTEEDACWKAAREYGLVSGEEEEDYQARVNAGCDPVDTYDAMAIDAAFGAPPPPADPFSDDHRLWSHTWEPTTMNADSRDAAEGPAVQ